MKITFKDKALSELYEHGKTKDGMVERLLFTETDNGIEVELLEIDGTHYGNKK